MATATSTFALDCPTRTTWPSHWRRIGSPGDARSKTKVSRTGSPGANHWFVSKKTPERLTSRVMPVPSSSSTGMAIGKRTAWRRSVNPGELWVCMRQLYRLHPALTIYRKIYFCISFDIYRPVNSKRRTGQGRWRGYIRFRMAERLTSEKYRPSRNCLEVGVRQNGQRDREEACEAEYDPERSKFEVLQRVEDQRSPLVWAYRASSNRPSRRSFS